MREELGKLLEHLGQREIVTWHVGGLTIQVAPKTLVMSWIAIAIILVLALLLRRALRQPVEDKPNRIQAVLDILVEQLDAQLTSNFSSKTLGAKLFPFVGTLFLYVLVSNWMSVLPGLEAPTTDPNVTLGLALMVLVMSHVILVRTKGLRGYKKELFTPAWLAPVNIMTEVIARPLSHGFRLFGNVFGEMVMVTVILARLDPFVFPVIFRLIFGLGFGLIQAFVFSILTVAYINLAAEKH